jgi:holo-[acyl-carrier protein] synthase
LGIGVDIEAVDRWKDPDPRLFTDEEHAYCRSRADQAEAYAGTWCAKEAVVKAVLPTAPILTREVSIGRDEAGAPRAELPGRLRLRALVSIGHSAGVALSVAVAVQDGPIGA